MYEKFARVYDRVFALKEEAVDFLDSTLKKGLVLDVACGVGQYAHALANKGFRVEAIDLSPSMIAEAKKHYAHRRVSYSVAPMETLTAINTYEGIYSLGNSLVHARDEEAFKQMITSFYQALKPGGTLVFQIINYARIHSKNITELPRLESHGVCFERYYELNENRVKFSTVLTVGKDTFSDSVMLLSLKPKACIKILQEVGFKDVMVYGSFKKAPFDEAKSVPFIVSAKKV